jgi:signal transduction histidine kinase
MQVLLGLQSNALKFTTSGSVTIIIDIEKIRDERYLKISVKDTGIGIPE